MSCNSQHVSLKLLTSDVEQRSRMEMMISVGRSMSLQSDGEPLSGAELRCIIMRHGVVCDETVDWACEPCRKIWQRRSVEAYSAPNLISYKKRIEERTSQGCDKTLKFVKWVGRRDAADNKNWRS
jgi:hypothetical protein